MKTYEQRVDEMKVPEDCDIQISKAKIYARKLHLKAKGEHLMLSEKLAIKAQANEADKVTRKLRINIFDLEDALVAKNTV